MKFTPSEYQTVLHRLEVPDALADCFEEVYTPEQVEDAVKQLKKLLDKQNQFTLADLTPCMQAVLIDCVEGSTYMCDLDDAVAGGERSKGQALSYHRATHGVEKKLHELFGRWYHFPLA